MRFALLLILPALFAGRAATASNAVPVSAAGSGAGAVSGYTISAISYSLSDDTLDGVSFTLSPATATTVKVRLAPDGLWNDCTVVGAAAACALATAVAEATTLEVVAAA